MPYKDLEKRRACSRESKRRSRAQEARIAPLRKFKIYFCWRFPRLPIGRASFQDGFLITDQTQVQVQVERHPEFGVTIFPLALELNLTDEPLMGDDE